MASKTNAQLPGEPTVVPSGLLKELAPDQLVRSRDNPRHLFDRGPLDELKKNIQEHGVLVPITVYQPKGQRKYFILDGERRHRCCEELEAEGHTVRIPANVVEPPTKIAGLLYMFSIHNFREAWELMPTALALKIVMKDLRVSDNKAINRLTGLSEPQIERCKTLLTFPEKFQKLSLDIDSKTRIPSNFWIEAYPVLNLCETALAGLVKKFGRDGLTEKLVDKYRARKIKSVIHFRRIMEAYDVADTTEEQKAVLDKLSEYILDVDLETRKAFDPFITGNRRIQGAIGACDEFLRQLERSKLDYTLDRDDLRNALVKVRDYTEHLLQKRTRLGLIHDG